MGKRAVRRPPQWGLLLGLGGRSRLSGIKVLFANLLCGRRDRFRSPSKAGYCPRPPQLLHEAVVGRCERKGDRVQRRLPAHPDVVQLGTGDLSDAQDDVQLGELGVLVHEFGRQAVLIIAGVSHFP